jgi:hypothetical protein
MTIECVSDLSGNSPRIGNNNLSNGERGISLLYQDRDSAIPDCTFQKVVPIVLLPS